MFEHEPTQEDLVAIAHALGLAISAERLAAALPEVRRLWAMAEQLGTLPLDDAPGADPAGAAPSGP